MTFGLATSLFLHIKITFPTVVTCVGGGYFHGERWNHLDSPCTLHTHRDLVINGWSCDSTERWSRGERGTDGERESEGENQITLLRREGLSVSLGISIFLGLLARAIFPTNRRQFTPRSYSVAEVEPVSGGEYISVGELMERTLCKIGIRLNMEMEKGVGVFFLDERKFSK